MPTRGVLQVQGASRLRATLKKAGVTVEDLKAAHAAIQDLVLATARGTVPRRTGALAGTLRGGQQQGAAVVMAGKGKQVPYANPIHWGWPKRHITAQPFLYDAIADNNERIETQYLAAMEDLIRSVEGAPGP